MTSYLHNVHKIEVEPQYSAKADWLRIIAYDAAGNVLIHLTLFNSPGKHFDIRKQVVEAVGESVEAL